MLLIQYRPDEVQTYLKGVQQDHVFETVLSWALTLWRPAMTEAVMCNEQQLSRTYPF